MLSLIGVIVAFIVIIILIYKKINFGISLIIGSAIVAIFSLQTIELVDVRNAVLKATIYSVEDQQIVYDTIELAVLLTVIYILAKSMQKTGAITKLIESLRSIFTKGGTLGAIPAVYGLMPVPGGALFSAPTIDEEGDKFDLDKNQKNFLNVWFRHIWFPIYPISSAMILITSAKFANFDIAIIMLANIPAFIASIAIGFIYIRKFIKKIPTEKKSKQKDYSGLIYLLPPVLPLIFYVFLQFLGIGQVRSFLIGIVFSIILLFYLTNVTKKEYLNILKNSLTYNLALAIIGIMIFREMFEASGANIAIKDIIVSAHIPVISMVILIPLILGVLTGYNLGSIALSYPILAPFFPADINFVTLVCYSSLIFISSLVGYLISPIHLCNVVSSDYLKTDTTRMYRMYIPAALSMLVVQTVVIGAIIYFSNI